MTINGYQTLSALGNAVLNSFWQAAIVWLLVIVFVKVNRKADAALTNNIAFIALSGIAASFVITFIYSLNAPETVPTGLFQWLPVTRPELLLRITAVTYLGILLVPVFKLVSGYVLTKQLNRDPKRVPGALKIFLLDTAAQLNIKKKVKIWISSIVESPITLGFIKPIILLPVAAINHLSIAQLETIVLHELAHIKRNDYLVNLVTQLIKTVLYFNPFVHSLTALQCQEREKAADAWVLQFGYDHTLYASTLFLLAQKQSEGLGRFALPAVTGRFGLLNRIEWIFGKKQRTIPALKWLLPLAVLFLLIPGISNKEIGMQSSGLAAIDYLLPQYTTGNGFVKASFNDPDQNQAGNSDKDNDATVQKHCIAITHHSTAGNADAPIDDIQPAEEAPAPVAPQFVVNLTTQPAIALTPEKEAQVKEAVDASKKIAATIKWEQIDHAIADAATETQKTVLKIQFENLVQQAAWKKLEDNLRQGYENIDWPKVQADLQTALAAVKLDSLKTRYKLALSQAKAIRAELENNRQSCAAQKEINTHVRFVSNLKKQVDSLNRIKVVSL